MISSKNNPNNMDNIDNKIIYDFILITMIILISILLLFDYLTTMIELKDEIQSIKKYVESLTNIENFNYKETKTKINLIMDNILSFQEEHDKNIIFLEEKYQNIENKYNNKEIEHQKEIEEIKKELKTKDEQYKNIENKLNKLLEDLNNKEVEHQKQIEENYNMFKSKLDESIENNKQLAVNIYYYWKTAHTIHPGLISMYDIIDGIYKHFYDTTFDIDMNNFLHEILEKTIPYLIKKKQQQLLDNTVFR